MDIFSDGRESIQTNLWYFCLAQIIYFASFSMITFVPRTLPVRRAAIKPTYLTRKIYISLFYLYIFFLLLDQF
jgi:hypothetical protein